jgi:uncharacterized protein YyaL (SSP411 family)
VAASHWGVSSSGNFEGQNVLFVPDGVGATAARTGLHTDEVSAALERARSRLQDARSRRNWPARDRKIIAAWNGLMIRAFAEAARAFARPVDREVAVAAGHFLHDRMVHDGRVTRAVLGDRASGAGFLEDQAATGLAFLDLHALTLDPVWLDRSRTVLERGLALFYDGDSDLWYDTAADAEALVVRPREVTDNATPSGVALIAELLLRWAELDDRTGYLDAARSAVSRVVAGLSQYPLAFGHMLGVADSLVNGDVQIALLWTDGGASVGPLHDRIGSQYVPGLVLAGGSGAAPPALALFRGRAPLDGRPTAFVCRGFACDLPATQPDELERQLSSGRGVLPASD